LRITSPSLKRTPGQTAFAPPRYPTAYAVLHWIIAALIISLFSMQYIRLFRGEEVHGLVRELHKSIGLVLIALILLRLVLRVSSAMPPRFPDASRLRAIGAHLVHIALWGLMMAVPAMGVAFLLARGRGVDFFGVVQISPLTAGSAYWGGITIDLHRYGAFILIGLVILHTATAAFHRFVLNDNLISRMSTKKISPSGSPVA
jgi:cytochrome b561